MIEALSEPLVWLILLPLFWSTTTFVLGPGRGAALAIAGLGLQLFCALVLAGEIADHGSRSHLVGGWPAPLGIMLTADGLATVMLVLTQFAVLLLAISARSTFSGGGCPWFWPLTGFLVAGMNALFVSGDLFNLYVCLELIGLAAVGLVAAAGGAEPVAAALRYLLAGLVGSGAYLLGVALLYGAFGTVSNALLAELIAPPVPLAVWLAATLMLVGLSLKTALWPLHFWLPTAHGSAPAPVSALLSALVVKASFFLILRLCLGPFAGLPDLALPVALIPALLGSAAIFWGSWMAIRTERLKMLVAYSTVAQVGYLFLIFPLFDADGQVLEAGMLQVVSHGLAKAAMFLAAGILIKVGGSDRVQGVAGAAGQLPVTMFAFALASVTLMGLPPSGGFLAKWLLIEAALGSGHYWIVVVTLAGGLLASIYTFRVLLLGFHLPTGADEPPRRQVPAAMEWPALVLAAASVGLGLLAMPLFALLAGVLR